VTGGRQPESAHEPGRPGLFVIGMHRSGTSAVTGMLARVGIGIPPRDDLVGGTTFNERGHYESKTLTAIDNQVLHLLGGTWSAPPAWEPAWEQQPPLVALRTAATTAFAATFPTRPMAWKDPRNCLVLPFWRSLLAPPLAAVLVYRDGIEVAHSLRARNQMNLTHGLALWERYVRRSCADLAGVPTFVIEYRRLLEDPASSCRELVRFLTDVGIRIEPGREQTAIDSLDPGLQHERSELVGLGGIEDNPRELLAAMRALDGTHHPWPTPDLGLEPEWVEDVLSSQRRYEVLRRHIQSSGAMRLVNAWWRLRGTSDMALPTEEDDE
jgi:hypothetical protein